MSCPDSEYSCGSDCVERLLMSPIVCRVLDWALDPSDCLPLAVLQGTIVLAVGAGIAVHGYVLAGFKWPSQRGGWA